MKLVGDISAGFPSAAEGYEDEALDLNEFIVRNPAATFFYRVKGDSLRHEFLRDGAILVVDRSLSPLLGRLVLLEDAGEFVVRRFETDRPSIVCGVVIASITRF